MSIDEKPITAWQYLGTDVLLCRIQSCPGIRREKTYRGREGMAPLPAAFHHGEYLLSRNLGWSRSRSEGSVKGQNSCRCGESNHDFSDALSVR